MNNKLFFEEFNGKTVVLTGGNGQIGNVIAKSYKEAGAIVVNLDIENKEGFELLPPAPDLKNPQIFYIKSDITKREEVEGAIEKIIGTLKSIDVLINCAGIGVFTPFENRSEDEFDSVMDVNLKGTFFVSHAVVRHMIKQKSKGVILNIGSMYGVSVPDQRIYGDSGRNSSEVYGMTKAGVIHFTRYLAKYFGSQQIRVNCISPGGIFANQDAFFVENYVHKTPLGRMGNPEDLIGGVFYLTSSFSSYVTGHNLLIDGGFTIGD